MAKSYFEKSVLKLFPFILILGLEIDEIIIILLENSVFIDFAKNVKFSSILSKSIFLNLLCLWKTLYNYDKCLLFSTFELG